MTNNNVKLAKNIINAALLIIVLILIVQNLRFVSVNFLFFSLKIPLLLLIGGVFAIGWFTSKATGGVLDTNKIKASIARVEESVEGAVNKGIHEAKEIADDIKEETEELVTDTKAAVKKATTAVQKATTRKTPVRKPTPTRKTPTKK